VAVAALAVVAVAVEVGFGGDCGNASASRLADCFLVLMTSISGRGGTTSSKKSRLSPCATVLAAHCHSHDTHDGHTQGQLGAEEEENGYG
jgi:hypothetical protein